MNKRIIMIVIFLIIIYPINITLGLPQNNKNTGIGKNNFDIITIINQLDESLLYNYLDGLVVLGPRFTGTENCSKAAQYLYDEFEMLGLDVNFDPWEYKDYKCKNVVATLNGSDPNSDAIFIICAHYDTTRTSPGANDDGSGVAAMMAIANICSQYSFNHTIRFIAFSGEEVGLYGSNAYAKKAYDRGDNIRAVLNLETFGYTSEGGRELFIQKTHRTEWISYISQDVSEKYYQYIGLKIIPMGSRPCDNQAFHEYGYDALQYVQINRGDYPIHSPEDSIEKINFSYFVNVTKLLLAITVEIVTTPIELQVRISTPYEGYIYIMDFPIVRLPGFNIVRTGFRGMTYIIGKAIVRVNITTQSEIGGVFFCLDGISEWYGELREPPYEWKIEKSYFTQTPLIGRHIISVYVWTLDGNVAYDEMDIFIISLH